MVRLAIPIEQNELKGWLSEAGFALSAVEASDKYRDILLYECSDYPTDALVWVRNGGDLSWVNTCRSNGAQWIVGGHWGGASEYLTRVLELSAAVPSSGWVSFVMQGESLDVDLGCRVLEELLVEHDWSTQKERGRLRTVAQEALTNAWEHGHGGDKDIPVEVLYTLSGDEIGLEVIDRGSGFVLEDIPDPMCPDNMLSESGRGIYIMQKFLDELSYKDGGRHLIGSKRA